MLVGAIIHPQSSYNKFVYRYKSECGDVYLTNHLGEIMYFDTKEQARDEGGNRPCWSIGRIKDATNPICQPEFREGFGLIITKDAS